MSYLSPSPVVLLLLPVDGSLLVIRRGIPPHKGKLALPGGFIDHAEGWRDAAARELREETGVLVAADSIRERRVLSASDGTLLVFGQAPPMAAVDLAPFVPNREVLERVLLPGPRALAFDLHSLVVAEFFARPQLAE